MDFLKHPIFITLGLVPFVLSQNPNDGIDQNRVEEFLVSFTEPIFVSPPILSMPSFFQEVFKHMKKTKRLELIVPGTKWCGMGNVAFDENDLGEMKADVCCREHDHCPQFIPGGTSKYGLLNRNFYTLSHCDCDSM